MLYELKNLFPDVLKPFYAGFGNRETDAIAYRYLDIPLNRCFIINPSSEVIQLGHTTKTTYQEIADNVDKDFPKLATVGEKSENSDIKSNMNLINEDDNNNIISSKLDEEGNTITIKTGENE